MIWALITEVIVYFLVALLILVAWFLFPFIVIRFAVVLLYLALVRLAWKRGN